MNLSLYRQCQSQYISFIHGVITHSGMDSLEDTLHVDFSEAAGMTSPDCSHEQSKEVQSGWSCDDESRWVTVLGNGCEDLIVRWGSTGSCWDVCYPLVTLSLNNLDDYIKLNKFICRKLGQATGSN